MSPSSGSRPSRIQSLSWSTRLRAGRLKPRTKIKEKMMSKVLVLYYSSYGHIEAMANAVAEGARQAGAQVDIKRVPELVPEEIARKSHYKLDQAAPIAKVEDLAAYDAIIIGAGTRFGRLEHCTARSAARSHRPPRNMADKRRRCSRSSPISCTSAWWLSAWITAM